MRDPRDYDDGRDVYPGQPNGPAGAPPVPRSKPDFDPIPIAKAVLPHEPEERLDAAVKAGRARGMSDAQIAQEGLGEAKMRAPTTYVQRYRALQQQYGPGERAKARAAADAKVKTAALVQGLAGVATALAGGNPSGVVEAFNRYREGVEDEYLGEFDRRRDEALKSLGMERQLGEVDRAEAERAELEDPESALSKAYQAAALEAGFANAAGKSAKAIQSTLPFLQAAATQRAAQAKAEASSREKRLDRENRLEAARIAAQAKAAAKAAEPSAGQEALDKQFGKDYADWISKGRSDAKRTVSELDQVADELEAEINGTGQNATGPVVGRMPDAALQLTGQGHVIDIRDRVENIIQRGLRATLGAQFTEKEGERLIARAYNPKLPEEQNLQRIRALAQQFREAAIEKDRAAAFFEENETLSGFGRKYSSIDDFGADSPEPEQAEERVVDGVRYRKVQGGWQRVK